jgi:hypothetical protein
MFQPTRDEVRRFFVDTRAKARDGRALVGLETVALHVITLHPELHAMLDAPERHLDRDYGPEHGGLNPFLHLSLHLAVEEQVSIDQPPGIRAAFETLRTRLGDEHAALHAIVDCLGEVVWTAQRHGTAPDMRLYFDCLERHHGVAPPAAR